MSTPVLQKNYPFFVKPAQSPSLARRLCHSPGFEGAAEGSWVCTSTASVPMVSISIRPERYSYDIIKQTGEFVINIPDKKLVREVDWCGVRSGRDIDKFQAFGLTPLPARCVAPPLVAECFANLECRVADTRLVNKYNLFVVEVVKAWIDPTQKSPKTIHHQGYGKFVADGKTIMLRSKMR